MQGSTGPRNGRLCAIEMQSLLYVKVTDIVSNISQFEIMSFLRLEHGAQMNLLLKFVYTENLELALKSLF